MPNSLSIDPISSLESNPYLETGKHILELSIPFISLYKPQPGILFSRAKNAWNIIHYSKNLITPDRNWKDIKEMAKSAYLFTASFLELRAAVITYSVLNILEQLYDVYDAPREEKLKKFLYNIPSILSLLAILRACSLESAMAALALRTAFDFYQSYQTAAEVKSSEKGVWQMKTLDGLAKMAMGFIRIPQIKHSYHSLKDKPLCAVTA